MRIEKPGFQLINSDVEQVFQKLTSTDKELFDYFKNYLEKEYEGDLSQRLIYYDIARIGDYIKNKLTSNQTNSFESFFNTIEEILKMDDSNVNNLIVIGLFESLQNHTDANPTYSYFNRWLGPKSKKEWDSLIGFWSGKKEKNYED